MAQEWSLPLETGLSFASVVRSELVQLAGNGCSLSHETALCVRDYPQCQYWLTRLGSSFCVPIHWYMVHTQKPATATAAAATATAAGAPRNRDSVSCLLGLQALFHTAPLLVMIVVAWATFVKLPVSAADLDQYPSGSASMSKQMDAKP